MYRYLAPVMAVALLGWWLGGCETKPSSSSAREALVDDAQGALRQMEAQDPSLSNVLNSAHGYAMFPSVGKGGLIVGGAYGRGVVYEQGQFIGYADLSQASVGAQLGGQTYAELLVFQDADTLNRFKNNQVTFSGNASATAVKAGAAATTTFQNGIATFTRPNGGLMAEASIGGQRFTFTPASHPAQE